MLVSADYDHQQQYINVVKFCSHLNSLHFHPPRISRLIKTWLEGKPWCLSWNVERSGSLVIIRLNTCIVWAMLSRSDRISAKSFVPSAKQIILFLKRRSKIPKTFLSVVAARSLVELLQWGEQIPWQSSSYHIIVSICINCRKILNDISPESTHFVSSTTHTTFSELTEKFQWKVGLFN